MIYIVYRCDLIGFGQAPQNEVEMDRLPTFNAAADLADAMTRSDPKHSFTVGIG